MRMRSLLAAALAASAVLTSLAISAAPPPVQAAGNAPACPFTNSNLRYCNRVVNAAGTRGSIGLVGDSVLLGSANGASNPGLPTILSQQGWSQVSLVATLGMRTFTSSGNNGGDYWVNWWKTNGFHPDVVAVNLGVNQLGTCTTANTAPCEARIIALRDAIFAAWPAGTDGITTTIWWAKIRHLNYPSGTPSAAMLGWNLALDRVAARADSGGRLVLWDWPNNVSGISMDLGGVHPVSGAEYVKRSTRMAAHLNASMQAGRQGTDVALPAAGTPAAYQPIDETIVYDTRTPEVPAYRINEFTEVDVSAVAPGATSVAITISALNAVKAGFLRVYACGDSVPVTSAVNFRAGQQASAQVITKVSPTGTVCFGNGNPLDPPKDDETVDVVISVEGWFGPAADDGFTPITPLRAYDPRVNGTPPAPLLRPTDVIVDLPTVPADATAAAIILTAVFPAGESTATAHRCGATPGSNPDVSLVLGETTAGASYVPITPATLDNPASICVHIESTTTPPIVLVDVMGWFRPGIGLQFATTTPTRIADTRSAAGVGPWRPNLGPVQVIDLLGGVTGAQAVSGTLTMDKTQRANDFTAWNCAGAAPSASAVNARAGTSMANNVTVGLNGNRRFCVRSKAFTHLVFDVVGYWMVVPT
ncbi:MAG: hypothetical protein RL238_1289 [Actinomycetota bacterium]